MRGIRTATRRETKPFDGLRVRPCTAPRAAIRAYMSQEDEPAPSLAFEYGQGIQLNDDTPVYRRPALLYVSRVHPKQSSKGEQS